MFQYFTNIFQNSTLSNTNNTKLYSSLELFHSKNTKNTKIYTRIFSSLGNNSANEERKRHDNAVEQLQKAQAQWAEKRTERLDWINTEIRKQNHAAKTFDDVDQAIREYNAVTAPVTGAQQLQSFGEEPTMSDYYAPSDSQKTREIVFIVSGMSVVGLIAYKIA